MKKKEHKKIIDADKRKKRKNGFVIIIVLVIIFLMPLLLFKFMPKFDLAFLICSYVFILTPFSMGSISVYAKKSKKYTEEQLKNGNIKIGLLILYYWLLDVVVLSLIEKWFWFSIIFGGIAIVVNLYDLGSALINKTFNNKLMDISMIFEFIPSILLIAYLIYTIPNEEFRNVLVPIVAATLGGMITLTGVYLTIKKSESDKKDEELAKAKPIMFAIDGDNRSDNTTSVLKILLHSNEKNDGLESASDEELAYTIPEISLFNSDMSNVVICGIKINNVVHLYDSPQIIHKDSYVILQEELRFKFNDDIEHISLLVKDILNNEYELETIFNIEKIGLDKEIKITEIKSTNRLSFQNKALPF